MCLYFLPVNQLLTRRQCLAFSQYHPKGKNLPDASVVGSGEYIEQNVYPLKNKYS